MEPKTNIIVVDNFYDDPEKIRKIALNSKYPEPSNGYTYPGKNSEGNYYPNSLHKKIEVLLQRDLVPAKPNGYFRISLEKDSFEQDIHVDPIWDWGGVLYLSDPKDTIPEAGTSFWKHKDLEMERLSKTTSQSRHYGYPTPNEQWKSLIYSDGLDRTKWERYFLCPMKYNRLVIFDSNLWHSHNVNFGTTLENGRLVQLFFFTESYGYV